MGSRLSFLLILITQIFLGQTEIPIGSPVTNTNAVLVVKNNELSLNKLQSVSNYSSLESVKLVDFKSDELLLDSVIRKLYVLSSVKKIVFSNCNLLYLTSDFSQFKNLEQVYIVDQSDFFENSLFPLLKENNLKELFLEMVDPEVIMDSISLLRSIEKIHITNFDFNQKPQHFSQYRDDVNNKTIELIEYSNYTPNSQQRDDLAGETKAVPKRPMLDCIKQPIPGININDTSYTFNSASGANFSYYSGSELSVDKNAFMYDNGKDYQGTVKLFYREFRNPVEIMLSGIPMYNNDGGEEKLFKSGGMYQIEAYDVNNTPLVTKSDTSVKINFALTDTSANFKFYSLNNNGSWSVTSNSLTTTNNTPVGVATQASSAADAYLAMLQDLQKERADTTRYNSRFYSNNYLYTIRKDNMLKKGDSSLAFRMDANGLFRNNYSTIKTRALFKIKYLKRTKDKEIVFTIVPGKKNLRLPNYISMLVNKTIVYTGDLTVAQFRKKYCQKVLCWDVRNNTSGNSLSLNIKTNKGYIDIDGMIVNLKKVGTYKVLQRVNHITNVYMTRQIRLEAYRFDTRGRYNFIKGNNLNPRVNVNYEDLKQIAYNACKKLMTDKENKMNLSEWHKYVFTIRTVSDMDILNNEVGQALVKSGMGIKNIDCYIHSGQMEDILVRYNNFKSESLIDQHNIILYKGINTSYPLQLNLLKEGLTGFYFKRSKNYIIRFSDNGFMQVTKPKEVELAKNGKKISISYTDQYSVKGLTSKDITKLILD